MSISWYKISAEDAIRDLNSSPYGLSQNEAEVRLKKYGENILSFVEPDSYLSIFFRQFASPLIYVLLGAAILVYFLGHTIDASIILAVIILNSAIGTIQEGKAQNALLALRKITMTNARVLRDGQEKIIEDKFLASGDIVLLEEGDKIPADARVLTSNSLLINEAVLTGESEAVYKNADTVNEIKKAVTEASNMVFRGTYVLSGNGRIIITQIGADTEMGKISSQLKNIDMEIPLRGNIKALSKAILLVAASASLFIFFSGLLFGNELKEMLAVAVAVSVSAIPEGLPVVITLVLATGVWRMHKKNVLVKRLQAVEALGQADVIAVDKTGTITKNEMTATQIFVGGEFYDVYGNGYEPKGRITRREEQIEPLNHQEIIDIGKIATFSSNSRIIISDDKKSYQVVGDPTDAALLVLGQRIGFSRKDLERENPRVAEIPFDSKLKYHAVLNHDSNGEYFMSYIGAPEMTIMGASFYVDQGKIHKMTDAHREKLLGVLNHMSSSGLRVIALADSKKTGATLEADKLPPLSFVGLVGVSDVIRPNVYGSVKLSRRAGVKVVMITGDHKITARAIAEKVGIYQKSDNILTGNDIDGMSQKELVDNLATTTVFARVSPSHKLKLIEAYKRNGQVVAMTGDGVNDALSLVAANLGVSMGKIGTEVAKEASDIVLVDDNFGNIISAMAEGRNIYKTIKKVIFYLFSTSSGEIFAITIAIFFGLPLILTAGQIIWLNLVTDGFLVAALAMDPKEKGILLRPYMKQSKFIVDGLMSKRILIIGFAMALITIFLYAGYLGFDAIKAGTVALTALAVMQWFNVLNSESETQSVFTTGLNNNKYLGFSYLIIIFLQIFAVYNPYMNHLLKTVPLDFSDWVVIVLLSLGVIVVEELRKIYSRVFSSKKSLKIAQIPANI